MKVFTSLCVDNKFGHPMMAEDCSYNAACVYIETELHCPITNCSKEIMTGVTEIETSKGITFVYDESRGCLMRKEKRL